MAISNATAEFNTFIKGIITEASPLTYPENASLDEQNFVLSRDGSRQRRLGIDYENGYTVNSASTNPSFNPLTAERRAGFYRWNNVAGNPALSIGIAHIAGKMFFLDLTASSPSSTLLNGGSYEEVSGVSSFTEIGGDLIVNTSSPTNDYVILTYDEATDTVSKTFYSLEVRDIWGVDDGLSIEARYPSPTGDSPEHKYNIYNQGWYRQNVVNDAGARVNPATYFYSVEGVYPSNADIWYYGKKESDEDKFYPEELYKLSLGSTPAPKGHYIINPYRLGAGRNSAFFSSGLPGGSYIGKVRSLATFAGRVFFGGFDISSSSDKHDTDPKPESNIYFSQVVNSKDNVGKCYQAGDPTSEFEGDIVATDGGSIVIPEINILYKLVPIANQLVVFAENGVWSIQGSDEGFSATNFQVNKLSNIGVVNDGSVVETEGGIFFWSKSGIYLLSFDQVSGSLSARNISEETIQTLYINIPTVGKAFAKGNYDEASRKVSWLYNTSDSYNGIDSVDRYDTELVFDVTLGAFYKNTYPESITGPFITDYVRTPGYLSVDNVDDIVEDADDIVEGSDDIVETESVRSRGVSTTKYLTVKENAGGTLYEFTLSDISNEDFLDWYTYDSTGTDAAAFLETGYVTAGDTQRDKASKYLTTHFSRTETGYELDGNGNIVLTNPSGCLVQTRWGFTDSANSGKWGTQFQGYRLGRYYIPEDVNDSFDYGHNVITTKNKVRGHGKALRFRFDTEAGKDMYLLGWAMTLYQESEV